MQVFSKNAVIDDFSKAATRYDAYAGLQHRIIETLVSIAGNGRFESSLVLDAGCGTGMLSRMIDSDVIQIDIAYGMCKEAARHNSLTATANITALPFLDNKFDVIFCASVLQWVDDLSATLIEIQRCVKAGGVVCISVFGQKTLSELREAFAAVDNFSHVSDFCSMEAIRSACSAVDLKVLNAETHEYAERYTSPRDLMLHLKSIGAQNKLLNRKKSITTAKKLLEMERAYIQLYASGSSVPATWEVHYLVLGKP